jgi:ADP-ribose pyrophosphatase YjhB (NUDIX family)
MDTQVHSGAYGILTNNLASEILLVRKSRGPYTGLLDLPGGRIEPGESPEDAVRREFVEETGQDVRVEGRIGDFDHTVSYSPPGLGEVNLHHIGVIFRVALTKSDQSVKSGPDGQDSLGAQWVTIDSLTESGISPLVSRALGLRFA